MDIDIDPPCGPMIYTIGVLESRMEGSTAWILPGVWEASPKGSTVSVSINWEGVPFVG